MDVEWFTDPMCSWSWGMQPQLLELRAALQGRAEFRLRLVGMVNGPDLTDPLQPIHQPGQWAPQWWEMSRATGMPCDPAIWHHDPPTDSRLACLAVAAARLQSDRAGWAMLRRLREAVMLERRNIARTEVIGAVADALGAEGRLDAAVWREDLQGRAVRTAMRDDMAHAAYHGIRRFPSLLLRPSGSSRAMLIVGWRPWDVLVDALTELGLDIERTPSRLVDLADGMTDDERRMLDLAREHLRGWSHATVGRTQLWRPPVV